MIYAFYLSVHPGISAIYNYLKKRIYLSILVLYVNQSGLGSYSNSSEYRSYKNSNEQIICSAVIKFSIWYSGNAKYERRYAREEFIQIIYK